MTLSSTACREGQPEPVLRTGCSVPVRSPSSLRALPMRMRQRKPERPHIVMDEGVRKVLGVLEYEHDVDFSCYKTSTLARRIRRRMDLTGMVDIDHYAALLAADREESKRLFHDLLIGVTEFLRDPDSHEKLAAIARTTLLNEENKEIRVWIAGCATGEEVYSMAILLDEARSELRWPVAFACSPRTSIRRR